MQYADSAEFGASQSMCEVRSIRTAIAATASSIVGWR